MAPTRDALHDFISRARWFGGKGRAFTVSGVRRIGTVAPGVVVELVEVSYDDPSTGSGQAERELYQLPLSLYAEEQDRLSHAIVGRWEDDDLGEVVAYDAVHDREAMTAYLRAFAPAPVEEAGHGRLETTGALEFVRLEGHDLDLEAPPALFSGEQSNSSVLYGDDSMLKIFRKVTPGENPDITTHQVLTEAGSTHVAALYGWIQYNPVVEEAGHGRLETHLAMLQQFLRTASDGWEQALASVRDLFAEADLHAEEVGGDFAGEASRLGIALAEVHDQLRAAFPTSVVAGNAIADGMQRRLAAAVHVVPGLAPFVEGATARFDAVRDLPEVAVQRVHGDLHLGQTLRTVVGWKLVDFEGEPAKPLHERLLPDTPWRDVAGMLRSFDYAPHAVAESLPEDDPDVVGQRAHRAEEWARRNRKAFLASYCGEGGLSDTDRVLLTAYIIDKAVYECVYEARNRPAWLPIPLSGVARLIAD